MNSIFDLAGGRKMVLSLLSLGALTLLAYTKPQAITTEFVTALIGLVTAFSASNVINTIKGVGIGPTPIQDVQENLNPNEVNITTNSDVLYEGLSEEVKVSTLNLQTQIDNTNARIEQLADIIQKSLLTQSTQSVKVMYNATTDERPVQNETKYTPTQADLNRQAISQYLTGSQPIR